MENFLIYLLKSAGILSIFCLSYYLFLRKETFFILNRSFLLGGILASFILPLIYFTKTVYVEAITMPGNYSIDMEDNTFPIAEEATINWWLIGGLIYFTVAAFFLIRTGIQLFQIWRIIKLNGKKPENDYSLIDMGGDSAPFSFFKYIFINPDAHSHREMRLILEHEKVHARQLHSADILLANITAAILWFNPFSWLFRKFIEQNLEFIADRRTVAGTNSTKEYQHTLVKNSIAGMHPELTNSFYQSFIKKRIVMLNKKNDNQRNTWKIVLVFPFLLTFMLLSNVKTEARIKNSSTTPASLQVYPSEEKDLLATMGRAPLYILDGESYSAKELHGKHLSFEEISGLSPADAIAEYGTEAKDGALILKGAEIIDDFSKEAQRIDLQKKEVKRKYIKVSPGYEKPVLVTLDNKPQVKHEVTIKVHENKITGVGSKKTDSSSTFAVKKAGNSNTDSTNVIYGNGIIRNETTSSKSNGEVIVVGYSQPNHPHDINAYEGTESNEQEAKEYAQTQEKKPLFIVDGKIMDEDFDHKELDANKIASINVLKGDKAIKKYGKKAANGAVQIFTKKNSINKTGIITSSSTEADLEQLKRRLKKEASLEVTYNSIKRNSDGKITEIEVGIRSKTANSSASFSVESGIPDIIVGIQAGTTIVRAGE
ncbi:M56 family metallopeptidase [Autumnicola musiva]|uniref:M56 family metallopeptidase n=1 Tax=Autumnicola musiva TaxID=3075589 RepID=A0ABU3D9A6_9FLAO|nr:M56 family metallopeptidase [Zunongwangia sp. F117]MDT0678117.1 M56 family metallopeptidase [Zunongwangia sp. F117]